jgi:transposase
MGITCGIDWAEAHHDAALVDTNGEIIARTRIDTGAAGFNRLALIAEHCDSVEDIPIAIETDKNLLVVALADAGFTLYPINPRAVARYRERHGQAGGKSDPGDAAVLAHVLRTDRHMHRPLPAISEQGRAVKTLARQHQEAVWALNQTVSRLRSLLLDFYPQAVQAFPNLKHRAATTVLAAVPTPAAAAKLTSRRVVTLLQRSGRGNHPALAKQILILLRAPALRQPPQVETAYGHTATGLIAVLVAMREAVDALEAQLGQQFEAHPQAAILRSAPGLGPVLAARVLGEIGDDPERFTHSNNLHSYTGTAPVTMSSGRSHYVKARKVRNKRLADACHWWPSRCSPNQPAHELTTTSDEPRATTTTRRRVISRTSYSDACGGVCDTTYPGTRPRHGQSSDPRRHRLRQIRKHRRVAGNSRRAAHGTETLLDRHAEHDFPLRHGFDTKSTLRCGFRGDGAGRGISALIARTGARSPRGGRDPRSTIAGNRRAVPRCRSVGPGSGATTCISINMSSRRRSPRRCCDCR